MDAGIAQGSGGRGRGETGERGWERGWRPASLEKPWPQGPAHMDSPWAWLPAFLLCDWMVDCPIWACSLLCEVVASTVPQGGPRMRGGAVLMPSGGS